MWWKVIGATLFWLLKEGFYKEENFDLEDLSEGDNYGGKSISGREKNKCKCSQVRTSWATVAWVHCTRIESGVYWKEFVCILLEM